MAMVCREGPVGLILSCHQAEARQPHQVLGAHSAPAHHSRRPHAFARLPDLLTLGNQLQSPD
eukprot:1269321-Amphidinium_carterae.1